MDSPLPLLPPELLNRQSPTPISHYEPTGCDPAKCRHPNSPPIPRADIDRLSAALSFIFWREFDVGVTNAMAAFTIFASMSGRQTAELYRKPKEDDIAIITRNDVVLSITPSDAYRQFFKNCFDRILQESVVQILKAVDCTTPRRLPHETARSVCSPVCYCLRRLI